MRWRWARTAPGVNRSGSGADVRDGRAAAAVMATVPNSEEAGMGLPRLPQKRWVSGTSVEHRGQSAIVGRVNHARSAG